MNQCDGCRRGLPVRKTKYGLFHNLSGTIGSYPGESMTCTAHLYLSDDGKNTIRAVPSLFVAEKTAD